MARIKGGQRLMQMSQRGGSAPQTQARTMVPGGIADRMQQGRGPVGVPPIAGQQFAQSKSKSGGIMKNFGKGLSNVFSKISQASRLGRQAGEMQRIEGELGGIAGQIDGMAKAKEQFDQGVDELSQAIVQNHIESVGLDGRDETEPGSSKSYGDDENSSSTIRHDSRRYNCCLLYTSPSPRD